MQVFILLDLLQFYFYSVIIGMRNVLLLTSPWVELVVVQLVLHRWQANAFHTEPNARRLSLLFLRLYLELLKLLVTLKILQTILATEITTCKSE